VLLELASATCSEVVAVGHIEALLKILNGKEFSKTNLKNVAIQELFREGTYCGGRKKTG
jgi:hypothetical protein